MNVMTDDLFIWILYVWSLCLSWFCSSWAKSFCVEPGQTNLPSLIQENFLASLFSPYYINHSLIRAAQTHILNGFISPYSLGLFCCIFSFAFLSDWKPSPLPSSLPIFFLSFSHLTHAFPKLTIVSLMGSPQKICPCPNPWDLWIWPYLEKKIFIDVMKLKILEWDHPVLPRRTLDSVPSVLTRDRRGKDTDTWRRPFEGGFRDWRDIVTRDAGKCKDWIVP